MLVISSVCIYVSFNLMVNMNISHWSFSKKSSVSVQTSMGADVQYEVEVIKSTTIERTGGSWLIVSSTS